VAYFLLGHPVLALEGSSNVVGTQWAYAVLMFRMHYECHTRQFDCSPQNAPEFQLKSVSNIIIKGINKGN